MPIPRPRPALVLAALVSAALAQACVSEGAEPQPAAATQAAPAIESEPAPAPAPAPVASADAGSASPASSLRFVAQAEWITDPPTSSMRKAQYRLPGTAGEATLVVYHFPANAGTLEANLERWAGQFEQPDGVESQARMTREQRRVQDLDVLLVDLAGTYVAETFPGSGERVREEGWRMLAAVIETPEGPYYAKLVGPADTVALHAERFDAFLEALR
jgi:hypothetical protein